MDGSFLNRIWEIFTYNGDSTNMLINYPLLVLTLYLVLFEPRKPMFNMSKSARRSRRIFILFLAFLLAVLQISICLWLKVNGISIIWSALAGLSVSSTLGGKPNYITLLGFAMIASGLLYYLIMSVFITTVAHGIAFLLGCLLNLIVASWTPLTFTRSITDNIQIQKSVEV